MSHPTLRRVLYLVAIILSILVLVLSLAGIGGTWLTAQSMKSMTVDVLNAVEKTAQVARNGVGRVDARVGNVRTEVTSVKAAADEISQNVQDKGLVRVLLPAEKETQLDVAQQNLVDTFASVRDATTAALDMYRAIDRLPLVNLPAPAPEKVQAAADTVDGLQTAVTELKTSILAFREGTAGQISRVSDAAVAADDRLGKVQTQLAQVDAELAALQARTNQLEQTLPMIITLGAIVTTLLLLWVAFSQVVVLRQAWQAFRHPPAT